MLHVPVKLNTSGNKAGLSSRQDFPCWNALWVHQEVGKHRMEWSQSTGGAEIHTWNSVKAVCINNLWSKRTVFPQCHVSFWISSIPLHVKCVYVFMRERKYFMMAKQVLVVDLCPKNVSIGHLMYPTFLQWEEQTKSNFAASGNFLAPAGLLLSFWWKTLVYDEDSLIF